MAVTSSAKIVALAVVAVTAALTIGAVPLLRGTLHYPTVTMTAGDQLQLGFVKYGVTDGKACEARVASLAGTLQKNCPACRVTQRRCVTNLSPELLRTLSPEPLDVPSARLPDGVVTYVSATPGLALASCQESERQSSQAAAERRVRCFAAGMARPRSS